MSGDDLTHDEGRRVLCLQGSGCKHTDRWSVGPHGSAATSVWAEGRGPAAERAVMAEAFPPSSNLWRMCENLKT